MGSRKIVKLSKPLPRKGIETRPMTRLRMASMDALSKPLPRKGIETTVSMMLVLPALTFKASSPQGDRNVAKVSI